MNRVEMLRSFIQSSPADPFPRYGLAMELKNGGQLDEAAAAFAELIEKFPDYVAAYFHAGAVLATLKRRGEARAVYQAGIVACERKPDPHTKSEIEAALAELGTGD